MNKKWLIAVLVVVIILIAGAFGTYYFENHVITKNERVTVTTLVENFASKMKDVSLSSPEDVVISEMKNAYSPFISKTLMEEWERNPSKIIGRLTSSPWPEKIEIDSVKKRSKYYIDVKGKIIYVTSGDGKLAKAGEIPVKIVVRRISKKGGYQIDWIEHGKYVSVSNEKQSVPRSVLYSDLKAKEIKTEFPAIFAVFPYNDEVVFSCGSGRLEQGFPPANINHIVVYNVKTDKVEYSQEISKDWMRIDKVQMNGNWIIFRAVLDKAGNNATCFAINRKTGRRTDLLNAHKGFKVNDMLLQGDYATLIIEKHEDKSNSKITELIRINLKSGEEQKYLEQKCFENAEKNFTAYRIWGIEGNSAAISVSKMKNGSEKKYVYLYNFAERSSDTVEIPKYINVYTIPPDEDTNKIIYLRKNETAIASLRKPDDFEEIGLTVFRPSTLTNDTFASKDYIVTRFDNGDIFVYNRKTKNRTIINKGKIQMTGHINLNGDILAAVNYSVNAPDGIIFIDLKKGGL